MTGFYENWLEAFTQTTEYDRSLIDNFMIIEFSHENIRKYEEYRELIKEQHKPDTSIYQ